MSAFLDWLVEWQTVLSWGLLGTILVGAVLTGLTTAGGIESGRREAIKVLALQKETSEARTQLEEQRQKTEEQREKTAKAEESLIQLRRLTLGSRTISKEAREKMLDILLKGAKGVASVSFVEADNVEPRFFAMEIEGLLKSAGWTIVESKINWLKMPQFPGTMVHFGMGKETEPKGKFRLPDHVKALNDAVDVIRADCGRFQFGGGGIPDLDECSVAIIVGPKL